MIRMGVSGWMFLLVPAHPGNPKQSRQMVVCVVDTVYENSLLLGFSRKRLSCKFSHSCLVIVGS